MPGLREGRKEGGKEGRKEGRKEVGDQICLKSEKIILYSS